MAENVINELIKEIEDSNTVGSIGYSTYKNLMSLVRQLQTC